jgi:hypothetical protein
MSAKRVEVNEAGRRVGETHHQAKLSDADCQQILALRDAGLTYQQIADKFDETVTLPDGTEVPGYRPGKSTVRDVCKGNYRAQTLTRWRWISTGDDEPIIEVPKGKV